MVTPDNTRYVQDITPGLLRQLHETLATQPLVYRNRIDVDYSALVRQPNLIASQCDDGYVLGLPFGRHLRIYYEFDKIEPMRQYFVPLLDDISNIARERSGVALAVLEFNDFPHRHHQEHIFIGAAFAEPLNVALLRCRDVREQDLPDAPAGVAVRTATPDDAPAIDELEERLGGDDRLAPPIPDHFFDGARWIGLAEVNGRPAGYLRLLEAEKRGLLADQFLVDTDLADGRAAAALLHAAFEHGRDDNRRALTLQVAQDAVGDPTLRAYGFKHAGDSLRYQRLADPAEIERQRLAKVTPRVKVGRIWGRF